VSKANVETVRLGYDEFNRGDVDGFLRRCAADFEFRDLPGLPGSGVFVGHDAFRAWHEQLNAAFEDLRFEVEEYVDAGDRVLVVNHATGIGRGSGAEVQMHFCSVWTLSGGEIVSGRSYDSSDEARTDAGLPPS
jgi:uncharacterized protein